MMRRVWTALVVLGMAGLAAAQTVAPVAGGTGPAATATPAGNAYSATVPVAGTSDAQRDAAMSAALAQVLQQVAPGFTVAPEVLAQAAGYVRNYQYRRAPAGAGLVLQVDFDPGAIGRLIAAAPVPAATIAAGGIAGAGSAAAATAAPGSGTLWVDGIDSGRAFVGLLALLRGDPRLHDVTPVGADGAGVMLHLGFDQPLATVLASLAGPNGHLAPDAQPHPGADAAWRWTP